MSVSRATNIWFFNPNYSQTHLHLRISIKKRNQRISNMCNIKTAANEWDGDSCRRFPSGFFFQFWSAAIVSILLLCFLLYFTLLCCTVWSFCYSDYHCCVIVISVAFPTSFALLRSPGAIFTAAAVAASFLWSMPQTLKRTHLRLRIANNNSCFCCHLFFRVLFFHFWHCSYKMVVILSTLISVRLRLSRTLM